MSLTTLRPELPALPARLRKLPLDARGYPVPWFVAWVEGQPDHRVQDARQMTRAVQEQRCWICGEPLGRFLAFLLGPMCAVTRTISEPPSHRECAEYAIQACPFLSRPHMHRRTAGLPEAVTEAAGIPLKRNPGVVLLWITRSYRLRPAPGGVLFAVGEPVETHWYCEGRPATRAEVLASVASGLPLLEEQARMDGMMAQEALRQMVARAMTLLPREDEAP